MCFDGAGVRPDQPVGLDVTNTMMLVFFCACHSKAGAAILKPAMSILQRCIVGDTGLITELIIAGYQSSDLAKVIREDRAVRGLRSSSSARSVMLPTLLVAEAAGAPDLDGEALLAHIRERCAATHVRNLRASTGAKKRESRSLAQQAGAILRRVSDAKKANVDAQSRLTVSNEKHTALTAEWNALKIEHDGLVQTNKDLVDATRLLETERDGLVVRIDSMRAELQTVSAERSRMRDLIGQCVVIVNTYRATGGGNVVELHVNSADDVIRRIDAIIGELNDDAVAVSEANVVAIPRSRVLNVHTGGEVACLLAWRVHLAYPYDWIEETEAIYLQCCTRISIDNAIHNMMSGKLNVLLQEEVKPVVVWPLTEEDVERSRKYAHPTDLRRHVKSMFVGDDALVQRLFTEHRGQFYFLCEDTTNEDVTNALNSIMMVPIEAYQPAFDVANTYASRGAHKRA